jgi:hypothetical protein
MPLRDHFHPPLSDRRHWHSFHNAWSTYLAEHLNQRLPEGYFAEPNAQFGIEIDVAAFSEASPRPSGESSGDQAQGNLVPSELSQWQPRSPSATLPFQPTTDSVEVQIFSAQDGPSLVGAIELVSPANKDRASHRNAFTSKCQTYLQQGIGVIIIDLVTTLTANLHNELMARLELQPVPLEALLYTVSYRVAETAGEVRLDFWQEPLDIAGALPIVPLFLKGGLFLPMDLEQSYGMTCDRLRIPI